MAKKALLAIDGGGIRGIIPLCALLELEKQTGKPARETFSFISGTSTGAIITGGLAVGMPVTQLLDMYQQLGPQVFRKDSSRISPHGTSSIRTTGRTASSALVR